MTHIIPKKGVGSCYILDARDIGGGQKKFKTLAAAKEALKRATHDEVDGKFVNATNSITFDRVVSQWLDHNEDRVALKDIGLGEFTNQRCNSRHILATELAGKSIGDHKIADLKSNVLELTVLKQIRFNADGELRAPATARKILLHLKSIFKFAVTAGHIGYDPAKELALPRKVGQFDVEQIGAALNGETKLSERISRENIDKIIAAAEPGYREIIETIAYTGVRVAELRAATWDQIDFGNENECSTLTINRSVKKCGEIGLPKTAAGSRVIPLDDDLVHTLRQWKVAQAASLKNLIFPNAEGNLADGDNWRNRGITKACKKAGVEPVTLRDLRHFFASILIFSNSFSEAAVTEIMGHTDINFTKKQYATWLKDSKRDKEISDKLTKVRRA